MEVARDGHDRHHLGGGGDVEPGLARVAVRRGRRVRRRSAAARGRSCRPRAATPIRSASILCGLPCRIEASSIAASRLLAAPIAWMSPVKWRFRSSIGTTWVRPPPAAPPLIPNTGPSDGSRRHSDRALADRAEALGQPDGGRRLALAGLRRRHAGDADELAVRDVRAGGRSPTATILRLVAAVRLDLVGFAARRARRAARSARVRRPGRSRDCSSSVLSSLSRHTAPGRSLADRRSIDK